MALERHQMTRLQFRVYLAFAAAMLLLGAWAVCAPQQAPAPRPATASTTEQGITPVTVQEPVTRPVMRCPDGYALWAREQNGIISDGKSPLVRILYKWFRFDGIGMLFSDSTPTCFKGDPNVVEPKK